MTWSTRMRGITNIVYRYPLLAPIALALTIVAVAYGYTFFTSKPILAETARVIVSRCSEVDGDRSSCYEREVPALYPELSVPELFDVIRTIRAEDPTYQFCHVLTHKIGERVVAEDPNAWISAIPMNPTDGLCSNGFIHGVIGGRFGAEVLDDETIQTYIPDFQRACMPSATWHPSDLDRAMCYHGIGHLFTFITDAQLRKSVGVCDKVVPDGYRRTCVQGVFMQIYQPLEPDDFALIERMKVKPTKETVRQFCATYRSDAISHGSCLSESWPFFREEILAGDVAEFCSWQPNAEEKNSCYLTVSSLVGRFSLGDADKAARACDGFPDTWRSTCYSYSAQAILEESRSDARQAIAFCESAVEPHRTACLDLLVDHARFIFGPNRGAHTAFCQLLDRPRREQCEVAIEK